MVQSFQCTQQVCILSLLEIENAPVNTSVPVEVDWSIHEEPSLTAQDREEALRNSLNHLLKTFGMKMLSDSLIENA